MKPCRHMQDKPLISSGQHMEHIPSAGRLMYQEIRVHGYAQS
jgi:hypothetical protein